MYSVVISLNETSKTVMMTQIWCYIRRTLASAKYWVWKYWNHSFYSKLFIVFRESVFSCFNIFFQYIVLTSKPICSQINCYWVIQFNWFGSATNFTRCFENIECYIFARRLGLSDLIQIWWFQIFTWRNEVC